MKRILFLFISCCLLGLTACSPTAQNSDNPAITVLESAAFEQKLGETHSPQLVDVRTPEEVAAGKLKGALNMDWNGSTFDTEVETLDKTQPVFVYCKRGGRSANSAARLAELGFTEIYDLEGGYTAWNKLGMETIK